MSNPPGRYTRLNPYVVIALCQDEWWFPERGGPIRIANMTDTHCWHTLKFLDREAALLTFQHWEALVDRLDRRSRFAPRQIEQDMRTTLAQEMADAAWNPRAFLRRQPLWAALRAGFTPNGDLIRRARHWSTCPRNRILSAPECTCRVDRTAHEHYQAARAAGWREDHAVASADDLARTLHNLGGMTGIEP